MTAPLGEPFPRMRAAWSGATGHALYLADCASPK
jgi:hypothetical protein